ncbi:unnamed protein product, partial [Effrenium voratum]
ACSAQLPQGFTNFVEPRRMQVFNIPWLPQTPVTNVVHEVNHYIHFPTPAPPAAPAPPSLDDFAPSPPEQSEMDRAKELQQQEAVVYKSSSDGICSTVPRPVTNWDPAQQLADK